MSEFISKNMNLGDRIRAARLARKMTQAALAHEIGVKIRTLQKYESGQSEPGYFRLCNLADTLEMELAQLVSPDAKTSHLEDMTAPSDFIRSLGTGRLADQLSNNADDQGTEFTIRSGLAGKRIGPEVAQWVFNQTDMLSLLDDEVGGKALYPIVRSHLQLVKALLVKGRISGKAEEELRLGLAHIARLAGWLAQDAGYIADAEQHYRLGIEMARSAGDPDFAAYCIALLAFIAVDGGSPSQCLTLLEAAESEALHDSPLHIVLRQWAVQPLGLLGRYKSASSSLAAADRLWDMRDADRIPEWLYWMLRPSLTSEAPRGFISGDPVFAERLLSDGSKALPENFSRDRALFLTGIAEARQAQGKLDAAMATIEELLRLAERAPVRRAMERLHALVQLLPDSQECHEMRERLHGISGDI